MNPKHIAKVRSLPGGYLAALVVASFASALIAYLEYASWGLAAALVAWTVIPALWVTDRISFDGRRLRRTGLLPMLFARITGTRERLKVSDIEQVETAAFPGIKRGRNVYYTYRTTVSGKNVRFVFSSGHSGYLGVIHSLFPKLTEDILDNTSIDLRDYLVEKREVRQRARRSDIPSTDVLGESFREIRVRQSLKDASGPESEEKANYLRRLANELRLSGRLLQAQEAFRRAAVLRPRDARLLFEFSECLRSLAGSESDLRLERRALAMMRLAERYAVNDRDLLARIGECYFQIGEWRRAAIVFKRTTDAFGETYRTLRGMAELSLREGKLAHVIYNFASANELAETNSLKRWTQTEVDYFTHLNSDEEYMELEISRVNLLETLGRTKRASVRISAIGLLTIVIGIMLGETLVANIGWTVSGAALIVWIVMIVMIRMLSPRIPFELIETDG
jgi:tetratricopeptide (TPR) repeat protein